MNMRPRRYTNDIIRPTGGPFNADGTEHLGTIQDDSKIQGLVDTIGGEYGLGDREKEVLKMVADNHEFVEAIRYLMRVTKEDKDIPLTRMIRQCAEIRFGNTTCKAGLPTKLFADNYQRNRVIVSGSGTNVWVSNSADIQMLSATQATANSAQIGFTASAWTREIFTSKLLWFLSDADTQLSWQEEWMP